MYIRAYLLALLCAFPVVAQNAAVDVLHYRVEMTLPASGTTIRAAAELTVRPVAVPLETLLLDFGALAIDEVRVDGKTATYERSGERLAVRIATQSAEPFRVLIRYHGTPADGLMLQRNKYQDASVFADNWPNRAHHWFPSIDHPSDKASVEFIVTAPARYDVVANGVLVETATLPDGSERTHWSEATPIPVHCMVIGATEFSVVRNGAIEYWLYPRDRAAGVAQFGRVPQMMALYEELIGPYPYDKIALVESSTRFGGMENASAIFFDEKRIDGKSPIEGLTAHEIAHQWFGDSISQREWHDLWLSEGFATYFCNLFFERADGRDAFRARMRTDRDDYLRAQNREPRPIHDRSIQELTKLLNGFNYEKGAWVLHMLRGIMGDAAFFNGIRDYYSAYRDRNANTAELRVVMERHHRQPLDWFFRQWIYQPGHPVFATRWSWRGGTLMLTIEQTQSGAVFRVPAVIELRDARGSWREEVLIDERTERLEIKSERKPQAVVLDPDDWVLKETSP